MCGIQGENQPLTEFPGIQAQIKNFYDDNATEDDWFCDEVEMDTVDASKVVNQSPTQVKLAVTYYFSSFDESPGRGGETVSGLQHALLHLRSRCDGALTLVSMSGAQRQS